jgi:hypothetical protein
LKNERRRIQGKSDKQVAWDPKEKVRLEAASKASRPRQLLQAASRLEAVSSEASSCCLGGTLTV